MDFTALKKTLENRRYTVSVFANKEEAADHLEATIQNEIVGFGGSVTLKEMQLDKRLAGKNTVRWHWLDPQDRNRFSDFTAYVTSVNAVSESGELVNIDGSGNRVSASVFGPKKVFFVIGSNKLAPDLSAAINRARQIASPPNCKRLNLKTPCVATGRCHDCRSPDRICNVMAIHMGPMLGAEHTEVVLIDEALGY